MIRRIIYINQEMCNGCGICAEACHEGAIQMIDGKAVLTRDDYCDGLGDCLPGCPVGAITFEEREALAYDEAAVKEAQRKNAEKKDAERKGAAQPQPPVSMDSCLGQWPVQIKLAPVNAPYFDNAQLLIAADCTAFAYGNFHQEFIKDHITLIGCPKLDSVDYSEKLTEIIGSNNITSITVTRMEVPCCGGIEYAAETALKNSGKEIPFRVVTIGINGSIKSID